MPNLQSGTFLTLYGVDAVGALGFVKGPMASFTLPTGTQAAIDALGAAQYGGGTPCRSVYIGSEVVLGADRAVFVGSGDIRNQWQTTASDTTTRESDKFGIPARDTEDPSLLAVGSPVVADLFSTPWAAVTAAAANALLKFPATTTGTAMVWDGGISTGRARVRPRARVRAPTTKRFLSGTWLNLWCKDSAGVKDFSHFRILAIPVGSTLITAIDALGNAIYGSIPGTTIKPSLAKYTGFNVTITLDNGFTGSGAGDVRDKWEVVATGGAQPDLRFTLPGRDTLTPHLVVAGTRVLADFSQTEWQDWLTAMAEAHIVAPQDTLGTAAIDGALSQVRPRIAPRLSIPH